MTQSIATGPVTVEPFAKAAKLPIDSRFDNKQPTDLAAELRANHQGKVILICWHHGQIRLCFARWEQRPKRYCQTVSGQGRSTIGSSWLVTTKTAI